MQTMRQQGLRTRIVLEQVTHRIKKGSVLQSDLARLLKSP